MRDDDDDDEDDDEDDDDNDDDELVGVGVWLALLVFDGSLPLLVV